MDPDSPMKLLQQSIITVESRRGPVEHDRQRAADLIHYFTCQVKDGCGDRGCTKTACYTYRLHSTDRPLRKLNSMSAKAMAMYLASLEHCELLLCNKFLNDIHARPKTLSNGHNVAPNGSLVPVTEIHSSKAKDSRKDNSSFSQHLFDTPSMSQLLSRSVIPPEDTENLRTEHSSSKCLQIITFPITVALASVIDRESVPVPALGNIHELIRQSCSHVLGSGPRLAASFRAETTPQNYDVLKNWKPPFKDEDGLWQILSRYNDIQNPRFPCLGDKEDPLQIPLSASPWEYHVATFNKEEQRLSHLNPIVVDSTLKWWMAEAGEDLVFERLSRSIDTLPTPDSPQDEEKVAHIMMIYIHALVAAVPSTNASQLLTWCSSPNTYTQDTMDTPSKNGPNTIAFASCVVRLLGDIREMSHTNESVKRVDRMIRNHLMVCRLFVARLPEALLFEAPKVRGDGVFHSAEESSHIVRKIFTDIKELEFSYSRGEISDNIFEQRISRLHRRYYNTLDHWHFGDLFCRWIYALANQCWDGEVIFRRRSTFHDCIELLAANDRWRQTDEYEFIFSRFHRQADPWALANAFIDKDDEHLCLLDYPSLFNFQHQVTNFRALCLTQMQRSAEESFLNYRIIADCLTWRASKDNQVQFNAEMHSLIREKLRGACSRHFALSVRRSSLLSDTFTQLWQRQSRELLRPLKVRIDNEGEEGVDQGGIAQEMLRLVFAEIFNPSYGAFIVDERTRMAWFDPKSLEPLYKYEMMGVLVSLAIHNGFTVPLTFPKVLYRKLCEEPRNETHPVNDLLDGWPDLYHGFQQLLKWEDGDVADVVARSYVFSFPVYDKVAHIDMSATARDAPWSVTAAVANADQIASDAPLVSNANRRQYVADYVYWLTEKSIATQFAAFKKGFHACVPRSFLKTLDVSTLQRIVEGSHELDVDELERAARYEGYTPSDAVIANFWAVVRAFAPERRTQLLEFVTASDRLPVTGVENIEFVIQRNGDDSERIPTSTTCFGRLLLPNYEGRERLRMKLEVALDNCAGFGLR